MSEAYEEVFNAFLNNSVPEMWHRRGYNSLKSLGSWIHDLTLRIDFIEVIQLKYIQTPIIFIAHGIQQSHSTF